MKRKNVIKRKNQNFMEEIVIFHLIMKEWFRKANSSSTSPADLKMYVSE